MTTPIPVKYAILQHNTRIQLVKVSAELTDATQELQYFTAPAGTLLKVVNPIANIGTDDAEEPTYEVQCYEAIRRELVGNSNYLCPAKSVLPVHDDLWPFLLSIPEPQRRLRLLQIDERRQWLMNVGLNDLVDIPRKCFESDTHYEGIIRYIGPVPELNAVGYFFGIELTNTMVSPQLTEIPFTKNYFECDDSAAIFTTADWVLPSTIATERGIEASTPPPNSESDNSMMDMLTTTYNRFVGYFGN